MWTKCVFTISLTTVDGDFSFTLKNVIRFIKGTICTKCVLNVPLTPVATVSLQRSHSVAAIYQYCIRH